MADLAFQAIDALSGTVREAVINLLYRLADDELIIGHRNSEWTGHAPILEADIAFSSMAQDEMGHAQAYYSLLHQLGERDPDTLAFGRRPREFRCASLVCLPKGDWGFSILRQFLYDASETVRLTALSESSLVPLAQLAGKLRGEEKYHLMHGRSWVLRLGNATDDSHRKMQAALDFAYPHALGLFEPTEYDEPLAQAGISPREDELKRNGNPPWPRSSPTRVLPCRKVCRRSTEDESGNIPTRSKSSWTVCNWSTTSTRRQNGRENVKTTKRRNVGRGG